MDPVTGSRSFLFAYDYSLHDRLLTIAGPTGSPPLAVGHYAESRSVIDPVYGSSLHDRPTISVGPTTSLAHSEFFDPLLDHMLAAPRAGIFEDSKQFGGTELLDLIRVEHPDFNFDFLYEEGEIACLAHPHEKDDTEVVGEQVASEILEKPPSEASPSQGENSTVFENLQDL
ncbi:hypothetical protein Fot_41973 [Forsythia ovata]|uniref:Uncharacterized protein n=1 Tax=Forsythia ovata TaxID=205694 RepID=A0ABD1RKL8_9LAMI